MAKKRTPNAAEVFLGKRIEQLRRGNGMTTLQLGRKIGQIEQQIRKYEKGGFVPLSVLEDIAIAFDDQIPKKLIRKISSLRKNEIATQIEQEELLALYDEAFRE